MYTTRQFCFVSAVALHLTTAKHLVHALYIRISGKRPCHIVFSIHKEKYKLFNKRGNLVEDGKAFIPEELASSFEKPDF